MKKTNALRILETAGIPYSTVTYQWDEDHLDAVSAAEKLALDPEAVFKTIVMISEANEIVVCCVPAPAHISLKKIKSITGKKTVPLKLDALQKTTGYVRGGCSPLGMKKQFPTFIDETAELFDTIYVNAGERGQMVGVAPSDLRTVCSASFCDLTDL